MDKGQFEIEILPLYKRVYVMCRAIVGDADEAADAVQETFVLLWEHRAGLDRVGSVEAYTRTVARNICLRRLRTRLPSGSLDKLGELPAGNQEAEAQSDVSHLRSLIDRLPPMQRRVMTLSAIGGCSNEEIAKITGESHDNVRQLLSRARKRIKEMYKEN